MPFELVNAPSTFQRMMDALLKNVNFTQAYLGDVVVHSKTMNEHRTHLHTMFSVISGHRPMLKISKCEFAKRKVELLGHIVSPQDMVVDKKKVTALQDASAPFDQASLRSFFWGLRAFI